MKTAVMTDINSGIGIKEGRKNGIYVLPMPVTIDGSDCLEGVNLSRKTLYTAIKNGSEISTSQQSPYYFMRMWDRIFADGFDEIVYIPMSSAISGSYGTAVQFAKAEYGDKIKVVDNRRVSITLLDSVYDAKYLAGQGANAAEIKTFLEDTAYFNDILITLRDLKHIKKAAGSQQPALLLR